MYDSFRNFFSIRYYLWFSILVVSSQIIANPIDHFKIVTSPLLDDSLYLIFSESLNGSNFYYYCYDTNYDSIAHYVLDLKDTSNIVINDSTLKYLKETVFYLDTRCYQSLTTHTFKLVYNDSLWLIGYGDCSEQLYNDERYKSFYVK